MSHPPRISLDLLRAFRCAARHLSFTRAARELHVTQSAISHAIRTLESQLGRPLFHRVNRTLSLTDAGRTLFDASDAALEIVDAAAARLTESSDVLSITTTTALASTWLAPRLTRFAHAHAGVDVRVVASDDMLDLHREGIDVALRFVPEGGDAPDAPRFVEYLTFPACAAWYARRRGPPLRTPSDLAHHARLEFEAVLYGRPWHDWEKWFEAMDTRPIEPAGALRFSHYDQVIGAALEGSGVAIGKGPHLARHLRVGGLRMPFGEEGVARLGAFHLVVPPAARRPGVDALAAWLRDEIARDEACAPRLLRAGLRRRSRAANA